MKLLEMTLVTKKRIPQFPGSIFPQLPTETNSPLQTLFQKGSEESEYNNGREDEMIMKALEIRRKVTAEIFKEAMRRKGKFGITYSTNLVNRLSDFIDFIMIEAAKLKRLPEFESSSFNVRAKTAIEDLNVVPLIRYSNYNGFYGILFWLTRGLVPCLGELIDLYLWVCDKNLYWSKYGFILTFSLKF